MTNFHHQRFGSGKPLLLIHGIGGSWRSWAPVINPLAAQREVIAIDLPGFGRTPPLTGEVSIRTLSDAVSNFLDSQGLRGVDVVGSSMGARLVLELARRGGVVGGVVSLDPGGFWRGWQRHFFYASIWTSIRLVRLLRPALPALTHNSVGRSLLFAQFSVRPWALSPQLALDELKNYSISPSFDELLYQLAYGEEQQGAARGTLTHPLVIGWGRRDRVCFPSQARLAMSLFPDAHLHWFERCGHFPQWDSPQETAQLVLTAMRGDPLIDAQRAPASDASSRFMKRSTLAAKTSG